MLRVENFTTKEFINTRKTEKGDVLVTFTRVDYINQLYDVLMHSEKFEKVSKGPTDKIWPEVNKHPAKIANKKSIG